MTYVRKTAQSGGSVFFIWSEKGLQARQNDKNNIGKIFNLDAILMISLLSDLENKNYVQVVRTAGLDVLRVKTDMTFFDCVRTYYKELGNE